MTRTRALAALAFTWLLALAAPAAAQVAELTQSFTLRPGWNAIHIELEPSEADIETVFAGLPVASVWRWRPGNGGAQFVSDPADGLENLEGWFAWFPEPRPEAFLSNLFRIEGNTAYLVKLEGSSNRQLSVRGIPQLRSVPWQPNGFTLTGLPVAASNAPSFGEYFSASSAHQGQPIYELGSNGRWQLVASPNARAIEPGRAYWIYTQGNSDYHGRMHVILDQGESLEYSAALTEMRIVLRNRSGLPGTFQIARVGGGNMPMAFRNEDPETGEVGWPALQQALVVDAPAGGDAFVTLAVLRRDFSADRMEQSFAITDELGQRVLLHAGGNTIQPLAVAAAAAKSRGAKAGEAASFAGLWVGEIAIDAVSESQLGGTTPTPVGKPFVQRFLVHVDNAGQARLLKDVIQMWEEGTTVPSASNPGLREVETPGRYVLITDKALLGAYTGAVNRGGSQVGIRYSTIAYDFAGDMLELGGIFAPGEQLTGTIVVGQDLPSNPFLHRYHPDHDNLDEQFLNPRPEAYQVVRNLQLAFTVEDPTGATPPGWGDSIVGGVFSESITGLHKNAIFVSGLFRMQRVSAVPVLNL